MVRPVLYDLLILQRSAATAFARKRDRLLLLVMLPLMVALVVSYAATAAMAVGALPLTAQLAAAAFVAMLVNTAIGRRRTHLREDSVVARYALRRGAAAMHACFWNLLPLGIVAGLIVAAAPPFTAGIVLLAYLAGAALAIVQQTAMARFRAWLSRGGRRARDARPSALPGVTQGQRAIALLAGRSGLFGPSLSANLLGLAAIGAAVGGLQLGLSSHLPGPGPAVVAGLLILILLFALLRAQPSLLRYLLYLGVEPIVPAAIASALAAALLGGALAMALLAVFAGPFVLLATVAMLLLLFVCLALLRTLHFATKSRQSAEIAIQLDVVAFALIGFLAPPLAPMLLVARLWLLMRDARAMRRLMP